MAQRGDGYHHMIRIYDKGKTVNLSVLSHASGDAFSKWNIVGYAREQYPMLSRS
ncbi:hypothetical protein KAR48_02535 [bacterium]|nr:hypothetical protein [bacterium]